MPFSKPGCTSTCASVFLAIHCHRPVALPSSLKSTLCSFLPFWARVLLGCCFASHRIWVTVERLVVPCQRTVLRERNIAGVTLERPQVDVPLVVHDQIRALLVLFMALCAIRVNKAALKARRADSGTLILGPYLSIGILWQNFQACIVYTLRNWRLLNNR